MQIRSGLVNGVFGILHRKLITILDVSFTVQVIFSVTIASEHYFRGKIAGNNHGAQYFEV